MLRSQITIFNGEDLAPVVKQLSTCVAVNFTEAPYELSIIFKDIDQLKHFVDLIHAEIVDLDDPGMALLREEKEGA